MGNEELTNEEWLNERAEVATRTAEEFEERYIDRGIELEALKKELSNANWRWKQNYQIATERLRELEKAEADLSRVLDDHRDTCVIVEALRRDKTHLKAKLEHTAKELERILNKPFGHGENDWIEIKKLIKEARK